MKNMQDDYDQAVAEVVTGANLEFVSNLRTLRLLELSDAQAFGVRDLLLRTFIAGATWQINRIIELAKEARRED